MKIRSIKKIWIIILIYVLFIYISLPYFPFFVAFLKNYISNENNITLEIIDNYNLNGDYIESQAFGFLAIRSFLNLPISFPETTGCKKISSGGIVIKNF